MAADVYLLGSLALIVVFGVVAFGAWSVRRRLVPEWSGAHARLAEAVIALAVPFLVAQVLGSFGQFAPVPMLVGCLLAGVGLALVGRGAPESAELDDEVEQTARRSQREEIVCAVAATAVVSAQWVMHTADALEHGMTHGDTLWYHAPFAARFVQTGYLTHASSTGLEDLATPLHTYLPLNGSVAHAILMLPFDRDVLSPVVNLGFFALALLAGWCMGARRGVGALTLLATVVMIGLPTLTGTQPGQASNDVVTTALFFAGMALLFESRLRPWPTGVAGVAVGLALGTKLTVLAPVAVVTIGVVVLALRRRRPATAIAWCIALVGAGGYWLVRNWVVAGNPVPWSEVSIGPFGFDRVIESRPALVGLLDQWSTWDRFVLPGLRDALGRGWVVVLALGIGGAVVGIMRRRTHPDQAVERVAGAAALVGIAALPFIPFSGDLGGAIFVFIVRYLVPELLLGVTLLVFALADVAILWRRLLLLVLAVLVIADVTSRYIEGAPLWPPYAAAGVLAGLGIVAVALLIIGLARGADPARTARAWAAPLAVGAAAALALVMAGGWFVQRSYLDHRYVDADLPHDRVNASFRDIRDARVAAIARDHFYPLFGLDLSNSVSRVDGPVDGSDRERCRGWRRELSGFDYVVLGNDLFSRPGPRPEWLTDDPAVRVAVDDGSETVFALRGPLDPAGCS